MEAFIEKEYPALGPLYGGLRAHPGLSLYGGKFCRVFILPLIFLSGCAGIQTTYIPLKQGTFPPRRPLKEVAVMTGDLKEPYEELGVILLRKYPGALEEEMVEKFQEEANLRGADAVIKMKTERRPIFSIGPFFLSFPFPGIEAEGVAVRYKEDP